MQTMKFMNFFTKLKFVVLFFVSRTSPEFLLRAKRNEKELKIKPATSFEYFLYLLTKKNKIK